MADDKTNRSVIYNASVGALLWNRICRQRMQGSWLEVVSLDRDMPADIRLDIMDWDYTAYKPKDFDVIWASPPCTKYSMAKTTGIRKIDENANTATHRVIPINTH